MDLIYVDAGLLTQLSAVLSTDKKYHLFTNNAMPGPATVLADLTEASFPGYASVTVTSGGWTSSGVSGHVGYKIAPAITFTNSSGSSVSVYGFFVTDSTGTILLAAARFDAAPIVIPNGGTQQVIPSWGAFSKFTS